MPVLVKISEGAVSTSRLLSDDDLLFEIHPPQRRFKWRNQQLDQLWDDLRTAHEADRDSYFLGTLLLVRLNGTQRVSVIDGQQRITSLSILLAVLRDHCDEIDDLKKRADGIQRLIARVDNDGKPVGPLVVTLQNPDNDVYTKLVKQPGSTKILLPGQDLLSRAAKRLTEHVQRYVDVPDREEHLRRFCEYVQSKVQFLPLEVRNEGEGYLVFDTSNTRGLRASPSEALKARLATIAREDMDLSGALMSKWNKVAAKLENAGLPIDAMDNYLHAVWCSIDGYTSKRTLDTIASKLAELKSLEHFIAELESCCESYLAVVAPTDDTYLTEDLKDLGRLNVQSHSFLMMVHKNEFSCFEEAVNMVLSLQIRNITMGPFQANAYEKDWPVWAMLVRNGKTQEAFADIRSHMITDEEFREQFDTETVASSRIVRHLLRRLDPISRPGSGVQPIEVDVEHILPKSVVTKLLGGKTLTKNAKRWITDLGHDVPGTLDEKQSLGKLLEPLLYRLGNQALLNNKANRGAKDLPFSTKKIFYKKQALTLTNTLVGQESWGSKEIHERQKEMAKRAHLIWPK